MRDRRVLITGGSGFIGSHLTKKLVQLGAKTYVLSRRRSAFNNIRLKDFWDKINVIDADLTKFDSLKVLKKIEPEIIFHLAAYHHVGYSFTHFSEALEINCIGTANLIESLDNYDCFIYTSSAEVYGIQNSMPFREDMTPRPLSPYAIGKYAGELYCLMKHSMGYPLVVLRPCNAFGPFQSSVAIVSEIIINCLLDRTVNATEGKQTRDFNFVDNIVEGFILAAKTKAAIGEVVNICSGRETSIRDLILLIHELSNSKSELKFGALPYRPNEIWRNFGDNTKAKRILNWTPTVSLEEGLVRTIEWYKDNIKHYFT